MDSASGEKRSMDVTKVLVVEDEADLREELVDYLGSNGYYARGAQSVSELLACVAAEPWHVLLLDLRLPDGDGLDAARTLRARHGLSFGIVMTTARGMIEERVQGLRVGADAYLVKPIDLRELRAQIDSVALRVRPQGAPWRLDQHRMSLRCPDGTLVPLTGAELILLAHLLDRPDQTVDRALLCSALGHSDTLGDTRRLDTLVSRLRTKVHRESGSPLPVHTFRSQGYRFSTMP